MFKNDSVFSKLQLSQLKTCRIIIRPVRVKLYLRTLTTWHYPHLSAAAATIDRYRLSAGLTAANLQQRVCCCGPMLRQTDGRTDTVPFYRPWSAYWVAR